ncbi:MAG: 30S ribosomal protein S6 [Candidatus Kapaibacterium sp.]
MAKETRYESTYIIPGSIEEDAMNTIISKVEDTITKNGGTLIETERWARRKLAYDIVNETNGFYVTEHFTAPGTVIAKLERVYQLDEQIIRWLTLVMPEENIKSRAAMKKRVEDVIARRTLEAANALIAEQEAAGLGVRASGSKMKEETVDEEAV